MSTPATHIWKPSHARLVSLDSFVAVPRGSAAVAPLPLNWPAKDPGDTLDYLLDIAPALVGNDGDGIATLDVTLAPSNPGDLTVQSMTTDGSRVVLWLAQGFAGTTYTITFTITTMNGRSLQEKRTPSSPAFVGAACSLQCHPHSIRRRSDGSKWKSCPVERLAVSTVFFSVARGHKRYLKFGRSGES